MFEKNPNKLLTCAHPDPPTARQARAFRLQTVSFVSDRETLLAVSTTCTHSRESQTKRFVEPPRGKQFQASFFELRMTTQTSEHLTSGIRQQLRPVRRQSRSGVYSVLVDETTGYKDSLLELMV